MPSIQKTRILFLKNYLMKYTDEEHTLTRAEIEDILRENGFECGRKTIYDDLEAIKESDVDIVSIKDETVKYYVGNRDFQLSEVKLLIDAVSCSRFFTLKKTEELIKKLGSLTSIYQAEALTREVFIKNRVKSMNETIYYAIDTIHKSINLDKAVTFNYFKWIIDENGIPKREFRHDGEIYTISPFGVSWNNGNYYMIGFDHNAEIIKHFRVDRMRNVVISEFERIKNDEFFKFDIESYSSKVFGMFWGEEHYVEMRVPNELADVFIDQFGFEADIKRIDTDNFIIGVKVAVSRQFFAWLMGLSSGVSIISPPDVVNAINEFISEIKVYEV